MLNKRKNIVLLLIIIVLLVFIYFADSTKGPILPCYINKLTGLYCPGCGMTRALHSILRLEFYQALRYNGLSFIMPLLYIIYYIFMRKEFESISKNILIFMIIIALVYGILRNISKFSYLAPTTVSNALRIFELW